MKRFIKEFLLLAIIILITVGLFSFILGEGAQKKNTVFKGKIDKKELKISSPVFGKIQDFSIPEGKVVQKNEVIALIKDIGTTGGKRTDIVADDNTIITNNVLSIMSPQKATIAKKIYAEGSNIYIYEPFITLYPLNETYVKLYLPKDIKLNEYTKFFIIGSGTNQEVTIGKIRPDTADTQDDPTLKTYVASFDNIDNSVQFAQNQKVTVRGEKIVKNGTITTIFLDIKTGFQNFTTNIGSIFTVK